jgi:hypothetical protein
MEDDRRQRERRQPPLRARVEVFTTKKNMHIALFADVLDLSEEGLCLLSPREVEAGDRVQVSLPQLESPEPLHVPGLVRWVERESPCEFRCGVVFQATDDAEREGLKKKLHSILVSYREQQPFRFS